MAYNSPFSAGEMEIITREEENAKRLLLAAEMVQKVLDDMHSDVYSGDSGGMQFDNAASDGGSLALLSLAKSLILAEVKE